MLWKILSLVSAVSLIGASYFAWFNKQDLDQERAREAAAQANVKAAEDRKLEGEEALKAAKEQFAARQKERDAAKEEVVQLTADAQEKEAALAVIKSNLDQVTQQVTSVEKQIEDAGDIERLVAQIENLKKDQVDAEGAVANQSQRLASVKDQLEQVNNQIGTLRAAESRGRRGIVDPDFTARIAQYFPEWDFAILNKGNSQGVFANADLEVKRGEQVIAKLKVRNVEQHNSIADLIPGSLAEGDFIRSGDTVVAAATQSVAVERKTESSPSAAAPADAMGGAAPADPFGAPAAAPAMGADPFGAPAAPAPAMDSDPFGAPAAPAAPAMGADPFAPAAAPAAPAAAPAMDADPFSMAPKP